MHEIARLERHRRFWEREPVDRPLVGFRIQSSYFTLHWFRAARALWQDQLEIRPHMVVAKEYAIECLALAQLHEETGQDLFWTAEPFTAIPWLEAIAGCKIFSSSHSIWAEHWLTDGSELTKINWDKDNPWVVKYQEFLTALAEVAQGRFPIGQPILRGPLDVASACMGATQSVLNFYDQPAFMQELLKRISALFLGLVSGQHEILKPFYNGYAFGFYHLWAPGPCIWLQEDAAAMLSPDLYIRYGRETDRRICGAYPYSMFHLHPASFFILDELLAMENLKVIQVNKDVGGPSLTAMLPELKRILEKKRLFLWGQLDRADLEVIAQELPYRGLGMQIFTESAEKAHELMEFAKSARMSRQT